MRTAEDMFRGFLLELNRQNTLGAEPSEFNYHVRIGQFEYLKMRFWGFERHQKSLDDLSPITVITNGIAGAPSPIANAGANTPGQEYFPLPADIDNLDEKAYLLKVRFMLSYLNNPCFTDGTASRWITAKRYSHNVDERNVFERDSDDRLYYQQVGANVIRIGEFATSPATQALFHYLRVPREITVNEADGTSNTNPELGPIQNTEIVKWTVASYTEKLESLRQRTMLEMQSQVFTHQDRLPAG